MMMSSTVVGIVEVVGRIAVVVKRLGGVIMRMIVAMMVMALMVHGLLVAQLSQKGSH